MSQANQLVVLFESEPMSKKQLDGIEKLLDQLFSSLNIDIEFTKHFFDRINDPRNKKQISASELIKIYNDAYTKFGPKIAALNTGAEALLKDLQSNVNIPFVIQYNKRKGELDMIAKTIMRKKNFLTRNRQFKV